MLSELILKAKGYSLTGFLPVHLKYFIYYNIYNKIYIKASVNGLISWTPQFTRFLD